MANNSRAYLWPNGWYGFLIIPDMTITLGPVRLLRIRQGSIVMTGQWVAKWIAALQRQPESAGG
jgi:hypothetical protein